MDGGSEVGYTSEGTQIFSGKSRERDKDDDDRKGKKLEENDDEDTKGKGVDCDDGGEEGSDDSEDIDGGIPIIIIEGNDRKEVAKIKIQNLNNPGYIPVAMRIGKKCRVLKNPPPLSLEECPHICFPWGSSYDTHYYHNENLLNPFKEPYDSFSQKLTSIHMVPIQLDAEGTITVEFRSRPLDHKIPKRLVKNYITLHKMVYFQISFLICEEPLHVPGYEMWPSHGTVFLDEGEIDLGTPPGYREFHQWLSLDSESSPSSDEDSQVGSFDEVQNNYDGGDVVDEHHSDDDDDVDDNDDDDHHDGLVNDSEIEEDEVAEENEFFDDFFANPGDENADNQVNEHAEDAMEVNDAVNNFAQGNDGDIDAEDIPGGDDWVVFLGKLDRIRIRK